MRPLLLCFVISFGLIGQPSIAQQQSNHIELDAQESGLAKFFQSLERIKSSNVVLDIGLKVGHVALYSGGSFLIIGETGNRFIAKETAKSLGMKLVKIGVLSSFLGVVGGVLTDWIWPSSADAATIEAQYLTPEGFVAFLNLPEEEMIEVIANEPRLEAAVNQVADTIRAHQ